MGDLSSNHTSDVRQHWVRDLAPVTGLVKVWKRLFCRRHPLLSKTSNPGSTR
jgi:hypothetical protein